MKQKDIHVGDVVYVKHFPIFGRGASINDPITINNFEVRIRGGNRYFSKIHKGYFKAHELTNIPCSKKKCPCK